MKTVVGEWRWRFEELSWLFYRKGSDQLKDTNCRETGELGNGAMVKASFSLSLNWLHWDGVNWLPPTLANCIECYCWRFTGEKMKTIYRIAGVLFKWYYLYRRNIHGNEMTCLFRETSYFWDGPVTKEHCKIREILNSSHSLLAIDLTDLPNVLQLQ